jgi:hypothetical protein
VYLQDFIPKKKEKGGETQGQETKGGKEGFSEKCGGSLPSLA